MITLSVISSLRCSGASPVSLEDLVDLLDEVGIHELLARKVDAHHQRGELGRARLPLVKLPAGGAENPEADREDEARLLGHRDEGRGRDQAPLRVIPAQQGLEPGDPTGREHDDRLVVDLELAALDRPPQVGLEPQPLHDARVHRLIEDDVPLLAQRLGPIHRRVGVAEQVLGPLPVLRSQRDPDAPGREDLVSPQVERGLQVVANPLGHQHRIADVADVVGEDRELVAPEPRERVAPAHPLLEPPADRDQELIAGGMPQTVIDHLEAVEVEEQDGETVVLLALRAKDRPAEPVHEQRPVGQVGQRVVEGIMKQLLLGHLAPGDVLVRDHHPHVFRALEPGGADAEPAALGLVVARVFQRRTRRAR